MPSTDPEPQAEVLRACYKAAPQPLYPGAFAQERGIDRTVLDRVLDELRLKGLVRLTEWVQGMGQGYTLTPAGLDLLDKPGAIRPGHPIPKAPAPANDAAPEPPAPPLIRQGPPVVSYTLIGVNVAVFVAGMFLASNAGVTEKDYLGGDNLGPIADMGSLWPARLLRLNEWWRVLTHAFLHKGLIHIALNMYGLYILGPLLEAMWGSWRMLVLYLVSAATGACVVIWTDSNAVGASGAIAGLLCSLGVWVLLNREHLPAELASTLMRMVIINLAILAFISFSVRGVSWQGHLGGAVGGTLASFPLQLSRYAVTWRGRVLGLLGVLLVAAVFLLLAYARQWGLALPA